jgi:N6-adenosine-specific RNA methylase IME4
VTPALEIPAGGYSVIVADPPWRFQQKLRCPLPYATMTDAELGAFAVDVLRPAAARDAHLWLWSTDAHLQLALRMVEAAAFRFVSTVVWIKITARSKVTLVHEDLWGGKPSPVPQIGVGNYLRHAHELCLFAVRGSAVPDDHATSTVIFAQRREHSRKPDELLEIAERLAPPGPRVELFARRARPGWVAWGLEAPVQREEGSAPCA